MRIHTERLLLRPFEAGDVDDVWAYGHLPEVAEHMLREPRDRDGVARAVRAMMTETELAGNGTALTFAVVLPETGAVIGEASLVARGIAHRGGEIGYVLHPAHHGRGLATEAAEAMLALGFDRRRMDRIIGTCSARNTASARVMERLGMRREAHLRGSRWIKGEWRDELVYAILADEWRLRRSR